MFAKKKHDLTVIAGADLDEQPLLQVQTP